MVYFSSDESAYTTGQILEAAGDLESALRSMEIICRKMSTDDKMADTGKMLVSAILL